MVSAAVELETHLGTPMGNNEVPCDMPKDDRERERSAPAFVVYAKTQTTSASGYPFKHLPKREHPVDI